MGGVYRRPQRKSNLGGAGGGVTATVMVISGNPATRPSLLVEAKHVAQYNPGQLHWLGCFGGECHRPNAREKWREISFGLRKVQCCWGARPLGGRNYISGNTQGGVSIGGTNTSGNSVQGNTIGPEIFTAGRRLAMVAAIMGVVFPVGRRARPLRWVAPILMPAMSSPPNDRRRAVNSGGCSHHQ